MSPQRKLLIAGAAALLAGVLTVIFWPRTKQQAAANGPTLLWEYFSDHNAIGSLALAPDGTIYVGSQAAVMALNPDGTLKWKSPANHAMQIVIGSDGNIYASSFYGILFGFSSTGQMIWQPGYGLIGFSAPPAVGDGGMLYYVNTVGDIYAFPPKGKEPAWSLSTVREGIANPSYILPGTGNANGGMRAPAVVENNGMIVVPRSHWLHEFSEEGHQAWVVEATAASLGPAALGRDGTIYLGNGLRALLAIDRSGEQKWSYDLDSDLNGAPVIDADGNIYVASPRIVYAFTPGGALKWQAKSNHDFRTAPILAADGTIYIGDEDGMSAYNSDGTEKWWFRMKMIETPLTIGADGTIYAECGFFWVCAVKDSGSPLMQSPWPKWQHDPANTGRVTTVF